MSDLAYTARALVAHDRRGAALLVQKPNGDYHVSPDGYGDGLDNVYVVSRAQIWDLMRTEGIRADSLAEPAAAEQLATMVTAFRQRRLGRS